MATSDFTTKICSKCKQEKPATSEFFHRNKTLPDGWSQRCKVCRKVDSRKWYLETQDEQIAYSKKYREDHPLETSLSKKRWRENNREKNAATKKKWQQANLHKHRQYNKKWRENHPEEARMMHKRHYLKDPRRYIFKSNVRRQKIRENGGTHTQADVVLQHKSQNGKCWWCGKKLKLERGKYHVDHLNPISKGGSDDPHNLVVSCPKCNLSRKNKMSWEWNGRLL